MAYPVSTATKEYCSKSHRQTASLTVTPVSGNAYSITEAKIIELSIDRACTMSENIELGNCVSSELALSILNDGTIDPNTLEGSEIFVQIGVLADDEETVSYIPAGYFTVDEVTKSVGTIHINALDRMMFFDTVIPLSAYTTWATGKTVADYVRYCCSQCGVTLATNIASYPNSSYTVPTAPTQENLTYRQLLMWCCQLMGKCAYIDWEGNLRIEFPAANANLDPAEDAIAGIAVAGKAIIGSSSVRASITFQDILDESKRYLSQIEDYSITTTGVFYMETESNTRHIIGTDSYAFDLSSNPFLAQNTDTLLGRLSGLIGIRYVPFTASCVPYPYIYPMDWIAVQRDHINYISIVTNINYTLNGYTNIASVGESNKVRSYARMNSVTEGARLVINREVKKLETGIRTAQQEAVNTATQLITSNLHGYVVMNDTDNDGHPDEILIMDTNSISTATKVWRWNNNGFGYSSSGYAGPYGTAITMNGAIVADYITTGNLNADLITTGTLNANRIKAGVLSDTGGNFTLNLATGACTAKNLSITGGSVNITADSSSTTAIALHCTAGSNTTYGAYMSPMAIFATTTIGSYSTTVNLRGDALRFSSANNERLILSTPSSASGGADIQIWNYHTASGSSSGTVNNRIVRIYENTSTHAGQIVLYKDDGSSSITLNGSTGTITASTFSGNATSATTATTATTATKLGSSTIGSSNHPIYLSSGTPTAVTNVMAGSATDTVTHYCGAENKANNIFCRVIASTASGKKYAGLYQFAEGDISTAHWLASIEPDGTAWFASTSDKRMKNDLGILSDEEAIDTLRIPVRLFRYKEDHTDREQIGIFAQDLRDVQKGRGQYRTSLIINDSEGEFYDDLNTPEENVLYGVDYVKLVPVLMKGWQIHAQQIAELKAQLGG